MKTRTVTPTTASLPVEITAEVIALLEAIAAANNLTRSDVADELLRKALGLPSTISPET